MYPYIIQKKLDERVYMGLDATNRRRAVGIRREDRQFPLLVIGRSGTGKTTLLEHMIVQDIAAGLGVIVLDPHGDLADRLSNSVPQERKNDILRFEATGHVPEIDFNACLKERKIIAISLSRGILGEQVSREIGDQLVSALATVVALQEAADCPSNALYIDEAYAFDHDALGQLLLYARNQRALAVTLTCAYVAQWGEEFVHRHLESRTAVAIYSCASSDAERYAREFGPAFTLERVRDQPQHHFFLCHIFENGIHREGAVQLVNFEPLP